MPKIDELPHVRHPRCTCETPDAEIMDRLTLQMSLETRDVLLASCSHLDMCHRSAMLVAIFAAYSILNLSMMPDERVDEEIDEAIALFREHRRIALLSMAAAAEKPDHVN